MRTKCAISLAVLAAAFGIAGKSSANAQEWPTRPVTMVITTAAGGGPDAVGRILASRLSEVLSRQVIVENIGGAGGMTATARVAKAPPDGYQFVLGITDNMAQLPSLAKNPPYNAATDFAPAVLIAEAPLVLIARKDLPATDLYSFTAYAKANASKMQFGSAGVGSTPHLACALLNNALGIDVAHIPYRGSAPAMQDLIAGRIDYQCATVAASISQIESKTVTPIAILSASRSPMLTELPSVQEQGGLENFDASAWFGFFFPKATSPAIVQKLHDATVVAMNSPSVQSRLRNMGVDLVAPERRSPKYLQEFVESEIQKWAAVIKKANINTQ
jgi:tripartite-type tricarboxylate transporter receptor subunit TctC